jgi:hypothetical protein
MNSGVTRLNPMLVSDFATLLDTSTANAIAFARSMVLDDLPNSYIYRVFPNQSCDEHLGPDELVYPDDSLVDVHDYIEMGRDDCIHFLYRDGRVPEWIDISVGAVDHEFTYIYLRCCGRFTANDERLYYNQFDRGPFGVKSPAIPPNIELGDREIKFWIGDAVDPPERG